MEIATIKLNGENRDRKMSSEVIGVVIIYSNRNFYYDAASSSAKSSPKGLDISSIPSAGDMRLTCVPLHTTNPSRLVLSLNLNGSVGSEF
jgi:hypothetical protein